MRYKVRTESGRDLCPVDIPRAIMLKKGDILEWEDGTRDDFEVVDIEWVGDMRSMATMRLVVKEIK